MLTALSLARQVRRVILVLLDPPGQLGFRVMLVLLALPALTPRCPARLVVSALLVLPARRVWASSTRGRRPGSRFRRLLILLRGMRTA